MILLSQLVLVFLVSVVNSQEYDLKIVTLATDANDGYLRFMRSARVFDLFVDVYGYDDEWLIRETAEEATHKIQILRRALENYKDEKNTILMITNSDDVIFALGKEDILRAFKNSGASILISADNVSRPDSTLADKYETLEDGGYKYLISAGGIIGYAPAVYEVLALNTSYDNQDEQAHYSHMYVDNGKKYNIKLDHRAELFQNLLGNKDHVELKFIGGDVGVVNSRFKTTPAVLHASGASKLQLNHIGNYVPQSWTYQHGCISCFEDKINLNGIEKSNWPTVLIALFIPSLTPFVDSFLLHIENLDYPKDRIHLFVHSVEEHHDEHVKTWIKKVEGEYTSVQFEGSQSYLNEQRGRNLGILYWQKINCDYYFSVDSIASLANMRTLQILIEENREFLAPMMSKIDKYWTNFWGDVGEDGYYARSPDYLDIVKYYRLGIWNVPFVNSVYLIKLSLAENIGIDPFYSVEHDSDVQFCAHLRQKGVFLHVTNQQYFGHLKELGTYDTKHKHNDLYQIFDNILDWEDKYLHPEYTHYLKTDSNVEQPCRDVYWVPSFTVNFTQNLIDECENFGKWSGGGHTDKRIPGGYENVPTVDIHMNQIDFEEHWLHILKRYYAPMAGRLFTGYYSRSQAVMNFVVKYTPAGQYFLKPHHDASTYTVNMALNVRGKDYEGGGARFLRYNCSVSDTKVGWSLLHPGRLTHQHEGLETTRGTRYIMISFVDP